MKLAQNSFRTKNYLLTVDNCRLAVNISLAKKNLKQAASAYELWISALFELGKYSDIKKVCCDARSKFGNNLDLLYYEFKAAIKAKDYKSAHGLAREFVDLHKMSSNQPSAPLNNTRDKLEEVMGELKDVENMLALEINRK